MRVAVMTLTRDRLEYSKHCFQTLRDSAGCDFDWFVADQASTDGTQEWLLAQDDLNVLTLDENIGICRALNLLLVEAFDPADYDVIVRFDNDCELRQPDTLRTICELADTHLAILSPVVLGLNNPPNILASFGAGDYRIDEPDHLGGIFTAIPATVFTRHGFRYDERNPLWGGDEQICNWWRAIRGGHCGYVRGFAVNHYETTEGQKDRFPEYWERKVAEMAA